MTTQILATSTADTVSVVQNYTYTVNAQFFWQGTHQMLGHERCVSGRPYTQSKKLRKPSIVFRTINNSNIYVRDREEVLCC